MTAVTEIGIALEWLYSTLSSDGELESLAPGGVFRAMAPPGTIPPYVIIAYQSGVDVMNMNAFRLMSNLLYQVKVVGPADMTPVLMSAATRIEQLIGGPTSGSATGGLILSCYRDSPLQLDELVSGELWTSIGGLYRPYVQQTS